MKRSRRSSFISFMVALAMLGSMLFSNFTASARVDTQLGDKGKPGGEQVASGTVVVSPADLQDWLFYNDENDTIDNSLGSFVIGPGSPLSGTGSVQISVTGTQRRNLATYQFSGTPLASITTMKFTTYNPSAGNGGSATRSAYLNFNVDFDGSDTWQRRLSYVPSVNGGVVQNSWQEWDTINGGNALWLYSGATWPITGGSGMTPKTWNQILLDYPGVRMRVTDSFLGIRVGEPYADGYTENIDSFKFGTSTGTTTYDFERGTTLTVDNDLVQCPGAAFTTIQAALNNSLPGDTIQVCAGSYNENVTINNDNITLMGAGQGTNPTVDTIIEGATPINKGSQAGITVPSGNTGVSIRNLRVQNFDSNNGIFSAVGNNNFTVDSVTVHNNNSTSAANGAGIFMQGPVDYVTVNNVTATNNLARGIVVWDGFKKHITLTNNTVTGNGCCGIELQDGTASGVTMTGNVVTNNGDSGMSAVGLTTGAGPNLIANNTVTNNGRFGIEIKLPNGTGLESGDGSIVVRNNTVQRTVPISGAQFRDLAGIAVFRRSYVPGNNNVDVPTGVVVKNNVVSGYQQPAANDGFGIVVEGLNMNVYGNNVSNNDVGIQRQEGHAPYVPNTATNGDQDVTGDLYFGRGNSPQVCAQIGSNAYSGNGQNTRDVGPSVNAPPCGPTAFAHLSPNSPITVTAGSTVTLDLLINSGGWNIRGQQSYITFPTTLLQNILVGSNGTITNSVTPDIDDHPSVLQNQVCNTVAPCTFGPVTAPGGSIAYASGKLTGPSPTGDFRVAQVGFLATQVGTANVHWQFSPPDPINRNSQINNDLSNIVSNPSLYSDYVINIVHATFTGHVYWEGRQAMWGQPDSHNVLPITLTLTSGPNVYTYTGLTTDASGNFTVNVDNIPNGTYTWRVKGPQYLSTSGTVVLSHAINTFQEMSLQPAGDTNNDNLVDITDFTLLNATFGFYTDPRADFNGDMVVDITDFTLLVGNFGDFGNRPAMGPAEQKSGSALLELRPKGNAPANGGVARVGDRFTLELWVKAEAGTTVRGQQGYLSFSGNQMKLGAGSPSSNRITHLTPDSSVLDVILQNAICNGSAGCELNGQKIPAGSLAFASGALTSAPGTGTFKVGEVEVQVTAPGTARLHWQFSPTDPVNRNTKITTDGGATISQPGQFVDYVVKVVPASK